MNSAKKPSEAQAQQIYDYFNKRFILKARWEELTSVQLREAKASFASISRYSDKLADELFAWTSKHIPPKIYSNAVRAANRKLAKYDSEARRNKKITTIRVTQETKYKLESVNAFGVHPKTQEDAIKILLARNDAMKQLELILFKDGEGDPLINKLNQLIAFYEAHKIKSE